MATLAIALIAFNGITFAAVGVICAALARRESSPQVRLAAQLTSLCCAAFTLGALQRLGLQLTRQVRFEAFTDERWLLHLQVVKSAAVAALSLFALAKGRRLLEELERSHKVVQSFTSHTGRFRRLSELSLTPRELEVLTLIGCGVLTDRDLAQRLSVSPHTAHAHVRNLMSKAGVQSRRDLIVIAHNEP